MEQVFRGKINELCQELLRILFLIWWSQVEFLLTISYSFCVYEMILMFLVEQVSLGKIIDLR
jgi:hypothetical protein